MGAVVVALLFARNLLDVMNALGSSGHSVAIRMVAFFFGMVIGTVFLDPLRDGDMVRLSGEDVLVLTAAVLGAATLSRAMCFTVIWFSIGEPRFVHRVWFGVAILLATAAILGVTGNILWGIGFLNFPQLP
jgi:hypothetical protein